MKRILWLFVVIIAFNSKVKAIDADSLWMYEHYTKKEVYIPMRDGVKLFTSIYIPKDNAEKHPFLMTRTPYSCSPYGDKEFRPFYARYTNTYLHEGYIMVIQDVRGRWMSEGTFMDVRPYNPAKKGKNEIDEASDTYDTIDWLVKNIANNNGKVGVFGTSYPGFYSTMAALSGHPALKAVSPQAPVTDWYHGDDFHHNGAFFISDAFSFYTSFGQPRPKPTTVGPAGFKYFTTDDNYEFYLKTGALSNFSKLMGDSIAFWNDLMNHGDYDAWWKARDVRQYLKGIQPAVLTVGGVFDAEDCFGAWNTYKAIEKLSPDANNRIVMGPWYHGQWGSNDGTHLGNVHFDSNTSEYYQDNIEVPFFNYYLKGKGASPDIAEATVFFTGENQWRKFQQWPPANVQAQSIYMQANGKLDFSKPLGGNSFSEYVSDPAKPVPYTQDVHFDRTINYMTDDQRFAERRPDVATFSTDVLTEDITLAGPLTAKLVVSTSGTDADFIVKLIDVFPYDFKYEDKARSEHHRVPSSTYPMGGYEMLVRGEIMRGKYRESFEKPVPFTPDAPANIDFSLPDVAHTFKKGHKIMVQVQSSWFPLVDRNPQVFTDIYHATDKDFKKATIRIYHDAGHPSAIELPVLK
ncbi:MAG: peptidase [Bacteroidetes bacterium]|uniref:CocE/NonD family hydrolase n=1 Tax=unclassified Chitinophaga TaxID=2619133 RepID=UPI0009CF54FF|nr:MULTISPECIES: CocE/NonD family hydrolase [unclassified Chitinophaga]MBP1650062.1 peptidase [Bacteroidota bacterium]OMP81008.1 X-Pro dipeptidyl-peptidase [[Flexibacter] sp. ATCC 35208]WPV69870.1 CocE/NonD family hydrolase [Chitinophaga sp. LS1]